MRVYLLMMVIAAAITFLLVPVVRRLAITVGAITQVRARDVHTTPIPRLGGLAMFGGMCATFAIASQIPYLTRVLGSGSGAWGVLIGAGLMCLVGIIDDIWELVWYAKLAGEILAAGVMAWQGVTLLSLPFMGLTVGSSRLTLFVTIMIVVTVVNAVNFVDGLDGLAAGIVGIAALAFFAYSYYLTRNVSPGDYSSVSCAVVATLVGVCAGFLPHNFHPARIFMGDSGALMLGVVIAGAGILVTGQIDPSNTSVGYSLPAIMPLLVPAAVILLPLIDFMWAVVRRLARGQSPFHADAGHLHHRLLRRGHSHSGAVLILYMWAGIASFSCVAFVIFHNAVVVMISALTAVLGVLLTRRELGGCSCAPSPPLCSGGSFFMKDESSGEAKESLSVKQEVLPPLVDEDAPARLAQVARLTALVLGGGGILCACVVWLWCDVPTSLGIVAASLVVVSFGAGTALLSARLRSSSPLGAAFIYIGSYVLSACVLLAVGEFARPWLNMIAFTFAVALDLVTYLVLASFLILRGTPHDPFVSRYREAYPEEDEEKVE